MTNDLTLANRDYATFLPSISSMYVRFCSDYYSIKNGARKGIQPPCLNDFEDLNFLNPNRGMFFYSKALYSAGHAFFHDLKHSEKFEKMIQKRDRSKTFIMGDSGGFQIGKGIIKFDWNDFEGNTANKVRQQILDWLEYTADYSMILDIPAWAIGKRPGIDSFDSCLKATMFNNDYFVRNRKGDTKFLNVLQGRSQSEADIWYEEVKDLPFEGWAFGGDNMRDFEMILHRIIEMRDNYYFDKNSNGETRNFVHFLGQSRLITSCAFSTLQRLLRKQVDENFQVTYDSASAFLSTAHGQVFTRDVFEKKRFSYLMEKMFDSKDFVNSDMPFPWRSTIGDKMRISDICVKPQGWIDKFGNEPKTSWDAYSYLLLMCHNVERHIKAIQQANNLYDMSSANPAFVPDKLILFKGIVEEVFESEKPFSVIQKHQHFLNKFTGIKTGKGVSDRIRDEMFDNNVDDVAFDDEVGYEDQEDELALEIEHDAKIET